MPRTSTPLSPPFDYRLTPKQNTHMYSHAYIQSYTYRFNATLPAVDYPLTAQHNIYMYIHAYIESYIYIYIASTPLSPPPTTVLVLNIMYTCISMPISNHIYSFNATLPAHSST